MFRKLATAVVMAAFFAIGRAHAQTGGLKPVEDMGNSLIATLDAIAPLIIIAALVVAGALFAFRAAGAGVIFGILVGGVLIANAPEITTWFGV